MKNKSTTTLQTSQHIIAGLLPEDSRIEFFGLPESLKVQFIQHGHTHSFSQLPAAAVSVLRNAYNANADARRVLGAYRENGENINATRQLELYTYFMYGGLDESPDFIDGILQEPENYRHTQDCISLQFKTIKLNGNPLKPREVQMIDLILEDHKNTAIALKMGIAVPTFNQHDAELKKKAGVQSKPALLLKAFKEGIAQSFNSNF